MELKKYYLGLEMPARRQFCVVAKTTDGYMVQLINGHRRPSPELARLLSVASGGNVTLADLRPDLWQSDNAA